MSETMTTTHSTPPIPSTDPKEALRSSIVAALKTCYDPEIPVDIWELGLVYRIDIDEENAVEIDMTLTSPMCPVAGDLPPYVRGLVESIDGVKECKLALVWDPPWTPDRMSETAKLELDMF